MPDALDTDLRHTVRLCWQTMDGQMQLKGYVPQSDEDLELMGLSREEYNKMLLGGVWGCGDSAPRLCELLIGSSLSDYKTAGDAVDVSDEPATAKALEQMTAVDGRVGVRLNVIGGHAGHSYVFLTKYRGAGRPLVGFVYQTNVGCKAMFDLAAWLDDPRSREEVNLRSHLLHLRTELVGRAKASNRYQLTYMRSGTKLLSEEAEKQDHDGKRARVVFQWRPVDESKAATALTNLRGGLPKVTGRVKTWAPVATGGGYRSTG